MSCRLYIQNERARILDRYFADFLAFFFPTIHQDIDWSRGYENLDGELQKVVRDAELGRRWADKLMKVWRCTGEEQIVLIHIEVQGQYEAHFSERLYVYNYRLFDRYQQPVVSLVVLADEQANWRPQSYQQSLWGYHCEMRFPMVKLSDYTERWDKLESAANPFALVVITHLQTQATRHDPQTRYTWKIRLSKRLHEHGYGRQDVLELFRFRLAIAVT